MKISRKTIWRYFMALALSAGLAQLVPIFGAQSQQQQYPPGAQPQPGQQQPYPTGPQQYPPQQQYPPGDEQSPRQPRTRTFVGEVVETQTGRYGLLMDKKTRRGFYLDHQKEAMKFKGQDVKVKGKLDKQTNTIHVYSIKPKHH